MEVASLVTRCIQSQGSQSQGRGRRGLEAASVGIGGVQSQGSQSQGRARGAGRGEVEKGARAIGGKNPPSQHSVLPTYDEGDDSASVGDGKDRRSHPGCGRRGGGPRRRARPSYLQLGHDVRGANLEGRRLGSSRPKNPRQDQPAESQDTLPLPRRRLAHPQGTRLLHQSPVEE